MKKQKNRRLFTRRDLARLLLVVAAVLLVAGTLVYGAYH